VRLAEEELLAPIWDPARNVFCDGKNYADHVKELSASGGDLPEHPSFFTKATGSVNGPFAPIPAHVGVTGRLDYEGELGVVIGRGGAGIPAEEALSHVFGYTIVNDVTARDLQKDHLQWFKGKSLDGFCPMGPWIVTADELPDAGDLPIRTAVNGEVRQDARTSMMIFGVAELIRSLSAGLTLLPGDVVATGTPAGVGMGMVPPRWLKPGDVVQVEIGRIGTIRNRVV
jgi:2-keto-4-pentenoate hydratase/2-oxohepta-3-ene-1,7-dioic acid hydratase in catechol pathway